MRIRPIRIVSGENGLKVEIEPIREAERIGSHPPSHLGYYHAPAGMPLDEAVKKLKACMIEKHERQIKVLQRSLEKLKKINTDCFKTENFIK